MAERALAEKYLAPGEARIAETIIIEWTGLLNTDTGAPLPLPNYSDKTFQAVGTFGAGGTVTIQGSNDPANPPAAASWGAIHRADGTAGDMLLTDVEPAVALEDPLWVRPNVTVGDGATSLTVRLVATTVRR